MRRHINKNTLATYFRRRPLLSATDQHFAFRKFHTGAKDRLSFKISNFAAQILRVDIQTKVRKFQEFTKIPGREKTDWGIETGS